MAENASTRSHSVPAWLVRFCRSLSTVRGLVWSTLFDIAVSLLATWLFTANDSDFTKFPLTIFLQHWYISVTAFLLLALLTVSMWAIGKLPVVESPTVLKRQYLARRILQTRDLAIEGIPLMPPRVQLDEIFIPLKLKSHQSNIDHLLTQEQGKLLREGIRRGKVAEEVESVLIDAARQYERLLKNSRESAIEDLWQNLTSEHPAAVIQGYPGMGKSTLLLRLTLYMARRGNGEADGLNEQLSSILLPIYLRLGRYASFRQQAGNDYNPSIREYLSSPPDELDELRSPDMLAWLRNNLERGQCLVLFDGLDEVSDPQERFQVQEAIKSFITDVRSKVSSTASYNRFLITSRVAGYDQTAFPGYPHYTIAELTQKQIKEFLPRWCRASVEVDRKTQDASTSPKEIEAYVSRQAASIEQVLNRAIESNQGIRELVENPFLLTLLAIMQQNGIELPHRRVELYTRLTQILLVERNARRGLPVIPEVQAIQRLGPIAYQMQATKNNFANRRDVLASFAGTIEFVDKAPLEQAQKEAKVFLDRVRERGGIFVLRTGDYYGFFHRTFQEYFAARHILHRIATNPQPEIDDLLQKARQQDDLWREPFLLAVAYKTNDEAPVACEMIRKLLTPPQGTDRKQRDHDVLLAGECLVEAKESTIQYDLERDVVLALLQAYEDAQQSEDDDVCENVEDVMLRLLLGVSSEAEHSALLLTLQNTILDTQYPILQRAVLTLLTMVAQNLLPCAPIVFKKIVPPLLGLTELPAVGEFQPLLPATSPDLDVIDLALSALSFLGVRGPAGLSLVQVRSQFEPYLRLLAQYSLQSNILITPTVVPIEEKNYLGYEKAVKRWLLLSADVEKRKHITEHDIITCIDIHQNLLHDAEEICYPAQTHFLQMLQYSQAQPDQPWEGVWQAYLREQMSTGTYIDYQLCVLLWAMLFPQQSSLQILSTLLLEHVADSTKPQRYARRFFLSLMRYMRDMIHLSDLKYLRYLRDMLYMKGVRDLRDLRDMRNLRYLKETIYLREMREMKNMSNMIYMRDLRYLRNMREMRNRIYLRNIGEMRYMINILFTEPFVIDVEQHLRTSVEAEQADLLGLLLGRVLQIQEANEKGTEVDQEIHQLVQAVLPFAQSNAREVVLDIIRYLPVRTEQEVTYILDFAQGTLDEDLQNACAVALRYSKPATDGAWALLENARISSVAVAREAVEKRLERRKRDKEFGLEIR